jgi:hypothetical protein
MTTRVAIGERTNGWSLLTQLVDLDGTAAHPHARRLLGAQASARDLSDLVHALCALYGHHPGVADHALARAAQPAAADWLADVAQGFATERSYLARLVAAAGPLPSTPGQAETEAALAGQRHAMEMLGASDRAGCATGTVVALVLDWQAMRPILDHAAERFGVPIARMTFPPAADTSTMAELLAAAPAASRAMAFGAEQLLAQVRGLWSLMEARASARG